MSKMTFTTPSIRAPSIVSPIRTLAVELLAEIFDLAIQDRTHIEDTYRVSHVCSDWRQIAHGTPRLWTRPLQVDVCRKGVLVQDGLRIWLARSAPLPVSLLLAKGNGDINPGILEEFLRVAPRWRSLRTQVLLPAWFISQLSQCRLDNLEELNFGLINGNNLPNPLSITAVPRLRKFNIYSFSPELQLRNLIPWGQLTDLDIHSRDSHVVFDILSQCSNLLTANVFTSGWYQEDVLVFGQLHTLTFTLSAPSETPPITQFFEHLSTPLLRKLRVKLGHGHWTQAHFTAFQLRAPNITHLEFNQLPSVTSDDLGAAIRHAPSLTHLTLDRCDNCFDDAFIRTLHYVDGVEPRAPRLHSLVVHGRAWSEDILAGMIASRWWTDAELVSVSPVVARWTRVELKFPGGLSPRSADILKDIPSDVLKMIY
ncbi:hypothetical protein C8R45DRAFT_1041721 [Mycena sanguinolenta]|nr:hypothetical protein C8R45DRAFT_1041721 [Mycena sanguinolenta]